MEKENKNIKEEILALKINTRMDTLTNSIYPTLKRWPKFEREGLTNLVRKDLILFSSTILLARKVKSKRLYFSQKADAILLSLKVKMNIASNQKYINKGFHQKVDLEITKISELVTSLILLIVKK